MDRVDQLRNIALVFLGLAFFWQTRINITSTYEIYDYLIPFVYLTDIVILFIFALETVINPRWFIPDKLTRSKKEYLLIVLIVFLLIHSIYFSIHLLGALYRIWRIILMAFFARWVYYYCRKNGERRIMRYVTYGLIPILFIGFAEVFFARSLGLQFIGEWNFSIYNPSIAKVNIMGVELLRPYATFPHPNVLGGVSAVFASYWFANLVLYKRFFVGNWMMLIVLFFGVVVSFSRTAIIAFIFVSVFIMMILNKHKKLKVVQVFGFVFLLPALALLSYRITELFSNDVFSLTHRRDLVFISLRVWWDNLWFGVGANQFILYIDKYVSVFSSYKFTQPVHLVWLVILVEHGIVGLFLFAYYVIRPVILNISKISVPVKLMLFVILLTSLFDHYWWTLPSGQLVLFLTIGITFVNIDLATNNAK